jgi:hypothetical protein
MRSKDKRVQILINGKQLEQLLVLQQVHSVPMS